MDITTTLDDGKATFALAGKLSVATAPDLEEAVRGLDGSVANIDMDLSALDYISSAGLRIMVAAQKLVAQRGGTLRLLHPTDEVREVFDMTGLVDVLTLEA